jgi:hypothetical protein
MTPTLRELIVLALLACLGFGLAAAHDDLFFVAIFGVAIVMTLTGAARSLG